MTFSSISLLTFGVLLLGWVFLERYYDMTFRSGETNKASNHEAPPNGRFQAFVR